MMQGKTCRIFTESVTHLVTTEVGSAKYHVIKKQLIFKLINSNLKKIITIGSSWNANTYHAT